MLEGRGLVLLKDKVPNPRKSVSYLCHSRKKKGRLSKELFMSVNTKLSLQALFPRYLGREQSTRTWAA